MLGIVAGCPCDACDELIDWNQSHRGGIRDQRAKPVEDAAAAQQRFVCGRSADRENRASGPAPVGFDIRERVVYPALPQRAAEGAARLREAMSLEIVVLDGSLPAAVAFSRLTEAFTGVGSNANIGRTDGLAAGGPTWRSKSTRAELRFDVLRFRRRRWRAGRRSNPLL